MSTRSTKSFKTLALFAFYWMLGFVGMLGFFDIHDLRAKGPDLFEQKKATLVVAQDCSACSSLLKKLKKSCAAYKDKSLKQSLQFLALGSQRKVRKELYYFLDFKIVYAQKSQLKQMTSKTKQVKFEVTPALYSQTKGYWFYGLNEIEKNLWDKNGLCS